MAIEINGFAIGETVLIGGRRWTVVCRESEDVEFESGSPYRGEQDGRAI